MFDEANRLLTAVGRRLVAISIRFTRRSWRVYVRVRVRRKRPRLQMSRGILKETRPLKSASHDERSTYI